VFGSTGKLNSTIISGLELSAISLNVGDIEITFKVCGEIVINGSKIINKKSNENSEILNAHTFKGFFPFLRIFSIKRTNLKCNVRLL